MKRNPPRTSAWPTCPASKHSVPPSPAKQNSGCPKPVASLGRQAGHTPFLRSQRGRCSPWHLATRLQVPAGDRALLDDSLQHPFPRAPWTGPPQGAERGWGALCAGPSHGKDSIQGARTVVSPGLDLPGRCPEAKLSEESS